jgi:hypothetical protein
VLTAAKNHPKTNLALNNWWFHPIRAYNSTGICNSTTQNFLLSLKSYEIFSRGKLLKEFIN